MAIKQIPATLYIADTQAETTGVTFPSNSFITCIDTGKNFFGSNTATGNAVTSFVLPKGTTSIPYQIEQSGSLLTTPVSGASEFDGVQVYKTIDTTSGRGAIPVEQYFHLTANGSTISSIANFFGANSNISLVASAFYEIEIVLFFLNTTSGTVTWTFTNSAAPTSQNIYYEASPLTGVTTINSAAGTICAQIVNDTTAALANTTGTLTSSVCRY